MAPKPIHSGNRYGSLDLCSLSDPPDPPPKRNKISSDYFSDFPSLPKNSIFKNPRFVHLTSKDPNIPLTSVSIFVLKKKIDSISTQYEKISQLRDGSILILTKEQNIANKFINSNALDSICPVNIKLHSNLNTSKGIAYAPCLINVSETEIVSELKGQHVTEVYKFTKKIDNKNKPTGLMLFSFDLFKTPESIEIGWYKTKINEYVPNPMRCRQCQRLGHTMKWCKNPASCDTCNLPLHDGTGCTRTQCVNCSGPHPASAKTCPRYIQNKEVLEIKTKNKCTLAEARRMQRERFPSSYQPDLYSSKLKKTNATSPTSHPSTPLTTGQTPKVTHNLHTPSPSTELHSLENKSKDNPSTSKLALNSIPNSKTEQQNPLLTTTELSSLQKHISYKTNTQSKNSLNKNDSLFIHSKQKNFSQPTSESTSTEQTNSSMNTNYDST